MFFSVPKMDFLFEVKETIVFSVCYKLSKTGFNFYLDLLKPKLWISPRLFGHSGRLLSQLTQTWVLLAGRARKAAPVHRGFSTAGSRPPAGPRQRPRAVGRDRDRPGAQRNGPFLFINRASAYAVYLRICSKLFPKGQWG